MKNKYISLLLAAALSLGMVSCSGILDESPKSQMTPEYFQTAQGLQSGVIAAYSGLKWLYGPDGALCFTVPGTDEFTTTNATNGDLGAFDSYDANYSPSNSSMSNYWANGLQYINTCNGVIEYGETATGLTDAARKALLGEAHFLRGYYYYLLTMYYGAVPLDLGSGKLKFNTIPSTTSTRDSRADVFATVIADLTYAKQNLPDKPSATGRLAKPAAMHFLAKAYLTRATLEGAQATDYQSAYDEAMNLINNASTYGVSLTKDFANINLEGHENDAEVLFNVQRTWSASGPNLTYEESNDGSFAVSNKGNRANFYFTAGYENVKVTKGASTMSIVPRSIVYQRPWRMLMPTKWLVYNAFSDKVNDARWDGSFRTEWNAGVAFKVKGRSVSAGSLAIKLSLNATETAAPEDSVATNGTIYKPYALYYWNMLYNADGTYKNGDVQYIYPNLKKYDDTKRPALNYDSNRPFILARLGETYLVAAEAAMYLNKKTDAKNLINVVRERAAYRSTLTDVEVAARKLAMDISESDVTLDFILDERSRELCGESWRWIDLVRTGKLLERVQLYNLKGKTNIKAYHTLRPIPQTQIDLMTDPAQKATYQNPNY